MRFASRSSFLFVFFYNVPFSVCVAFTFFYLSEEIILMLWQNVRFFIIFKFVFFITSVGLCEFFLLAPSVHAQKMAFLNVIIKYIN